jgi:MHS family metabolite:H+ symporter-like MFS transporter
VAREASAVLVGGIAPLICAARIAWLASAFESTRDAWLPIACYVALLSLITVVTRFLTPEPRGRDLDNPRDAGQTTTPTE